MQTHRLRFSRILALSLVVLLTSWILAGDLESASAQGRELGTAGGDSDSRIATPASHAIALHISTKLADSSLVYQQEVSLNSSEFQQYLNQNLSNILFAYANGTPINAWIQSGAANASVRTTIWLSLAGLVNRTIYLELYPKNVSLLDSAGFLGEAPQLSPVYAEFDNGARVFPFYDDFDGNSLNRSAWVEAGPIANYSVSDGFLLGDSQWGGLLSQDAFNASSVAPGLYLNYSTGVYLNVAVGTDVHVRLLGSGSGRYLIGEASGFSNGTFGGTQGFDFFSFWTNSTEGHIDMANQTLNISYNYSAGSPAAEQLSIRSDSAGWIDVKYALLRNLPVPDSGYMPEAAVSGSAVPLIDLGLYNVDFAESGLPSGQSWFLDLLGVGDLECPGSSISLALPNGTYDYLAYTSNLNYTSGMTPASFIESGSGTSESIQFSFAYAVVFHESGLPLGWLWTVRLTNGVTSESNSYELTLRIANGSYSYSVQTPDPSAIAAGGNLTVSGLPSVVSVQFVTPSSSTADYDPIYYATFLVGLGIVVSALIVRRARRPTGRA